MAAQPQTGFGMRANARPARRAGPIVRPPPFRPEWADEGGHRRAMNRSGGLLRSGAGRLNSANRPRPAPTGPPPPGDPSAEGSGDPYGGPSREASGVRETA